LIKVAYVALAPFISGSERCLQLILENTEHAGIDPILITPVNSPLESWATKKKIKHLSVDLRAIHKREPWNWLYNQIKIFWLLYKNKVRVVHSNQLWSFKVLDLATKILKIKRVCHFRDPINSGSKWWLPNSIDVAIFISKHIENEFKNHFSQNHAKSTITLIDPVYFNPRIDINDLADKKNQAKEVLNISITKFTFGFIGQIAPIKGVIELINILSKLESKNWQLLIAGKDPSENQEYLKQCKKLIQNLGLDDKVKFCGFLDNTQTFYRACDLITMFSIEEPLGLIPLEAAVNYTPAIANAVGGLPETINDQETGWLVDINNEKEVKRVLESAMKTNLNEVGNNARLFVEKLCIPSTYCKKLAEIYNEVL
jgi:glycosyltransferase involved in cell wall biosynthesis